MFRRIKSFAIISTLLSVLLLGGVYASWAYSTIPSQDAELGNIDGILEEWYYEDHLPGGGETGSEDFDHGISHAGLIQDILEDILKGDKVNDNVGNSTILHALEEAIQDNSEFDGVGSSSKYGVGNTALRDFAGANGYTNLGFFLYYGPGVTDFSNLTRIEIYTYNLSDTDGNVGAYIDVYKTIATFNGTTWILTGGLLGEAKIERYGNQNTTGKYKNIIDPESWTPKETV